MLAEIASRRRARVRGAWHPSANREAIKAKYELAKRLTEFTGEPWEVDHIKPLNKGGLHHEGNLQVVPKWINMGKRFHTERWYSDEYLIAVLECRCPLNQR